ncbi:MAG: beta-lactamase family protein [Actinomycetota bacterium]|nr:beta-lactamase family protein [Actinomycetota bacterium]MDQ3680484.1 beta-lactamase family protein [Actinomycetota bacterium]
MTSVGHLRDGRVDPGRLDALLARARQEVDQGVLPSCQIAVAHHGELVALETFGDASDSTRYVVFSSIKAFVAATVWALMGEGVLDVGSRVGDYVPEFATRGKEAVTVEHLLVHTAGFPHAALGPPEWYTRKARLEEFGRWTLEWEPGTAYGYHPTSAHWVLAEIIERVSGTDFCDAVHRFVTEPAGLPRRVLGVRAEDQGDIATIEIRGRMANADELEEVLGVRELPRAESAYEALLCLNVAEVRALGIPGGGGIMRADDLALFYQALLHNQGGIWDAGILADATGTVRNRFADPLFGSPANRTLGLVMAGDDGFGFIRGFGTATSPRAFGHGGAAGQIGWADPESGLSLAFATNGIDVNVIRQGRRGIEISTLAGACVVRD